MQFFGLNLDGGESKTVNTPLGSQLVLVHAALGNAKDGERNVVNVKVDEEAHTLVTLVGGRVPQHSLEITLEGEIVFESKGSGTVSLLGMYEESDFSMLSDEEDEEDSQLEDLEAREQAKAAAEVHATKLKKKEAADEKSGSKPFAAPADSDESDLASDEEMNGEEEDDDYDIDEDEEEEGEEEESEEEEVEDDEEEDEEELPPPPKKMKTPAMATPKTSGTVKFGSAKQSRQTPSSKPRPTSAMKGTSFKKGTPFKGTPGKQRS